MKRMKLFVLAVCALALAVVSVIGTMAYLTDSAKVVNTFTVGNVHLRLDEAEIDENGIDTGKRTEKGNQYHLIPGKTYIKDPTVTVIKGSEEAYVRMIVTINCYDELTAIFGDPFLPQYFVEGWDDTKWLTTSVIAEDEEKNTATYEFRYFETVKPEKDNDLTLDALFDTITVPSSLNGDQLATIAKLSITVEAHAIQASGFADADEAWGAFSK